MKKRVPEIDDLNAWLGTPKRHSKQTHRTSESDAEILKLHHKLYLATTIDSVSEEIAYRLYRDPYTMGWVTAMATLSDLAAVGVEPQGLLFSAQWGPDFSLKMKKEVSKGLKAALAKVRVPLLGGDTGAAVSTLLSGVAVGTSKTKPLSRMGAKPGDFLFISGPIGNGPALAFQHVLGGKTEITEKDFRPVAQTKTGQKLISLASSSMDMSDGLAVTLQTITALNHVTAELDWNSNWFTEKSKQWCQSRNMPLTSLCFGEHGDFQLLLTIPPKNVKRALTTAKGLIPIGVVTQGKKKNLVKIGDRKAKIEFNLMATHPKDSLENFRLAVQKIAQAMKKLGLP